MNDDLPTVPVRHIQYRKSPKHAWKRGRQGEYPVFCRDCATTNPMRLPENPDAVARPWSQEHIRDDAVLAPCEACDVPVLQAPSKRRKHVYCSPACRSQIYRDAAYVEPVERPCEQCGAPMTGRADRRYCSSRCRVAAHRETADPASPLDALADDEVELLLAHRMRKMRDMIAEE